MSLVRVGKILLVLMVAFPCMYVGACVYRIHRHRAVYDRMETAIARMALRPPSDVTDDQWAYCMLRTWNLHTNYGGDDYIPTRDLQRIVEEFEVKIDAGPSLSTIDWLWDAYSRSAPRAHNYERYRPTSAVNRSELEAGNHGGNPLSWWRTEYERRVSRR